jgi:hypothetical protein
MALCQSRTLKLLALLKSFPTMMVETLLSLFLIQVKTNDNDIQICILIYILGVDPGAAGMQVNDDFFFFYTRHLY